MRPTPWPTPGSSCPRAFSLVELLVVLGVLALQAAVLLPALGRVRESARSVSCLGNLRQWGLATSLYAGDHDDLLPPEGKPNPTDRDTQVGWYIQLPRQLDLPPYHAEDWRTNPAAVPAPTPFLCPANRRRSNGRNLFHYCLNQHVDGSGEGDAPVRLGSLTDPGRLVWLFDSKNLPAVGSWGFVHTNLHGGGARILFLDGHVRGVRKGLLRDPATGRPPTNGPELRWHP